MTTRTAIIGAGETRFEPAGTPNTSYDVTCEAARRAADDAGIATRAIDGIVKYSFDGALSDTELATLLGCKELTFSAEIPYGGGSGPAALAAASAAIRAGLATTVLCYRTVVADEWWGQLSKPDLTRPFYRDAMELLRPLGWYSYQHLFGMLTHRHMTAFGTSEEDLGHVIVAFREHARHADNAVCKDELSIAEYLASPFTVQPLRLADDVVWVNGGCAVIVTSADRAADARNGAAHIVATAQSTGSPPQHSFEFWPARADLHSALTRVAGSLWSHGIKPGDVQTLQCYDTTPISVVLALEGFGFCPVGEGGPFIRSGGISGPGRLEVCTNGGHSSGGYIHGFSQVIEAVRRLRPQPSGGSPDLFSVVSGAPTTPTSAALLASQPV